MQMHGMACMVMAVTVFTLADIVSFLFFIFYYYIFLFLCLFLLKVVAIKFSVS